ncbi:hypothetical protein K1719_003611 [Acacia pycnantha]|nr:hypothetical protein K1719_003611 [Acacia pycnantha]
MQAEIEKVKKKREETALEKAQHEGQSDVFGVRVESKEENTIEKQSRDNDDEEEKTNDKSSMEPDADDNIDVNKKEDNGNESCLLNEENKDIKKLIEETMGSCLSPLNNINTMEGSRLNLVL